MLGEIMVLSHRNHGNFPKKLTCFLNPNQKEKPKCQNFSEINNYELCIVNCGVQLIYCYKNYSHFAQCRWQNVNSIKETESVLVGYLLAFLRSSSLGIFSFWPSLTDLMPSLSASM